MPLHPVHRCLIAAVLGIVGWSSEPPSPPVQSVPLSVLSQYQIDAPFIELAKGRINLTAAARDLAVLDPAVAAALETLLTSAYGGFRETLRRHAPEVEPETEPGSKAQVRLTFTDLTSELRPLRQAIDQGIADLVAAKRLSADQRELLQVNTNQQIDSWFFAFGKELQTVTLGMEKRPGRHGGGTSWHHGHAVRRGGGSSSGSGSGGDLPEEYRVFLDFTDLAPHEALPRSEL